MKRKYMPLILMLTAGAVTSIITYVRQFPLIQRLTALLIVLLVFYGLGTGFKWVLDTFDRQNAKAALDKGEVIEKEGSAEEADEKQQTGDGQE